MPWVLDGNNLAGGSARATVRRAALELARSERVRIVLFFDGAPPAGRAAVERLGAVEVRYVRDADAAILTLLADGGRGWRVATNDRALAARAKAAGAEAVGGTVFWEKVERATSAGAGGRQPPEKRPEDPDLDGEIQRLPPAAERVRRRRLPLRRGSR